ncbi:matrix-remodeling-associated protein 7 [Pelodytes ibericus]
MELGTDYCWIVPVIFTVLAIILATLLMKLRSGEEKRESKGVQEEEQERVAEHLQEEQIKQEEKEEVKEAGDNPQTGKIPVDEVGPSEELCEDKAKDNETEAEECAAKERRASSHSSLEDEDSKEEDFELESDKILKISEADEADDEDFSFKYIPGKLRGSDYEKMLTKDELEEEQRVQREQLGAIFQMMEKNQETFGAMSDRDVKEQLKLYNM